MKYVWARGGYTPLLTWIKDAAKCALKTKSVVADSSYAKKREGLLSRPPIARLWLIAAMLDMFLLYAIYLRFLHWTGRVVICDRYVADTRIDFSRNFPKQFSTSHWLWRLLVVATPRPEMHFLLYVPIEVSQERSREKDEPFPDSPATLEYRLNEYLNAMDFSLPEIVKIDCQSPIGMIQEEIQANFAKANQL